MLERTTMEFQRKIKHLEGKHQNLHKRVEALEAENAPEFSVIKAKKEKLLVKDEINRLYAQYESDSGIEYFGR